MKRNVLIFCVLLLTSCTKYEDGGRDIFTNRQYKKISGEWAVEKRLVNNVEKPFDATISKYRLFFDMDGNYKESYFKDGTSVVIEGTWADGNGDAEYSIYTQGKGNINITITRLKNRSMWFHYSGQDGNVYEFHLMNARKAKD
jgi:hypothetical protein